MRGSGGSITLRRLLAMTGAMRRDWWRYGRDVGSLIQRSGQPKAIAEAPVAGRSPVAESRAEELRIGEIRAPAHDTVAGRNIGHGRAIGWSTRIAVLVAIVHPLIDVTMHIMQAERIGRELTNRGRVLPLVPALL